VYNVLVVRINISLPTKLLIDLDSYCMEIGDSRSGLIADLVRKRIYENLPRQTTTPQKKEDRDWKEVLPKPNLSKMCSHCIKPFVGTYKYALYSLEKGEEEFTERLCENHVLSFKNKAMWLKEVKE